MEPSKRPFHTLLLAPKSPWMDLLNQHASVDKEDRPLFAWDDLDKTVSLYARFRLGDIKRPKKRSLTKKSDWDTIQSYLDHAPSRVAVYARFMACISNDLIAFTEGRLDAASSYETDFHRDAAEELWMGRVDWILEHGHIPEEWDFSSWEAFVDTFNECEMVEVDV